MTHKLLNDYINAKVQLDKICGGAHEIYEDDRNYYWFVDSDSVFFFEDESNARARFTDDGSKVDEYNAEIVRDRVFRREALTFILVRDDFGGSNYVMVLDNDKEIK